MIFQEFDISFDFLMNLLKNSPESLDIYISKYTERRFYIGDTDISRKTFNIWKKTGLLPYKLNNTGWQKISFVENCWLSCIRELGDLGVSLKKTQEIKNVLFNPDVKVLKEIFIWSLENYDGEIKEREKLLAIYKSPEATDEIVKEVFETFQVSIFFIIVLATLIGNQNIYLLYTKSGTLKLINFGVVPEPNYDRQNREEMESLFKESFIGVSFRKIVTEIFRKEDMRHNDGFIVDFLTPRERKIVDHIRERNAKEITIRFNDTTEPAHLRVTRNRISDETINKLARYLKKGNYQTIEFITRNGELIKYEETDIIKL